MCFVKFLGLLLFLSPAYGTQNSSSNKEKNHLRIKTENKALEKTLRNRLKTPLTKEKITDFLVKEGYFKSRIRETPEGFSIANPVKMIFILKGNHFFNDYNIKKIIKTNAVNRGIGFKESLLTSLKTAYQTQGFQKISIESKKVVKDWKEWVYLTFHEGPRIKISEIKVAGLISKPSRFYVNFIRSNSPPLIQKGYFNKKDLETGYKNLILFLKKSGYLQSKIYSDRIVYKDNKAYITVNLDEGPLTLIKTISFSGNKAFSHFTLANLIKSRIFEPLKLKTLEEDISSIEKFYKSHGYLQMKILNKKNIVNYSEKTSYVNININFQEGVQSRISKILIEGAKKTKESFIRDLLKFKKGEVLTPKKIRTSRNTLVALGIFSRVSIDFEPKEQTAVTVFLTEKKPRLIRAGAGINTERDLTARAYTEFTYRNLFQRGGSLFGKVNGHLNLIDPKSIFGYELSGIYQEFFSPSHNLKGNVGVSRNRIIFNYKPGNIRGVTRNKIRFFMEKQFNPQWLVNWSLWDFETSEEFCIRQNCPKNPQNIGSTSLSFTYDKRDNIFNPSKGLLISLSGEYADSFLGSSSDIQFSKINLQNQFYISFAKDYTLAAELRGGFLLSNETIPVSRAFILGGQATIRGYDGNIEGERIPNKAEVPIVTANESLKLRGAIPVTSSQYGLLKLEMRFPLFKAFKGLVFYDGGGIHLKGKNDSLFTLGHSAGIGVRYESFLIPIGLDFAYKLPPKQGQDFRFHFAIGFF